MIHFSSSDMESPHLPVSDGSGYFLVRAGKIYHLLHTSAYLMPTSLGHLSNRVLVMANIEAYTKPCYIVMYLLILSWIPKHPF